MNYRGSIAERKNVLMEKICGLFVLSAYAEEVNPTPPTPPTPTVNYEELIAKARKEEKDKQYKTIDSLKGQVSLLTEQHNKDILAYADLERKYKDLEQSTGNVKSLQEKITTLEAEKTQLQEKLTAFENKPPINEEEIRNKLKSEIEGQIKAEYDVKLYKAEKLAENKDTILVPELVTGNTKEEIDTSIQKALERSAEIRKSLGIDEKQKRTPKTKSPSVNSIQDKEISVETIANMDVRSPEYAELRRKLGLH